MRTSTNELASVYRFVAWLLNSSDEGSFFDVLDAGGNIWVEGGILWLSSKLKVSSLLPSNGVDRVDPVGFSHLDMRPVEVAT